MYTTPEAVAKYFAFTTGALSPALNSEIFLFRKFRPNTKLTLNRNREKGSEYKTFPALFYAEIAGEFLADKAADRSFYFRQGSPLFDSTTN